MEKKQIFVDINNARGREKLLPKLQRSIDTNEDPFSLEHIAKYHGKPIMEVCNHWYVTESDHIYPGAKQHFLIIAKEYIETVHDITPEAQAEMFEIIKKLSREHNITGGGFFMRYGDSNLTGATVKRLHAHVIGPDPDGDGVRIPLG